MRCRLLRHLHFVTSTLLKALSKVEGRDAPALPNQTFVYESRGKPARYNIRSDWLLSTKASA